MYEHIRTYDPNRPLVEMRNVSKKFALDQDHQRSFQERVIGFFQPKKPKDGDDYFWSVRDTSLILNPGDSIGLVGANGSGKSTLLKLVTGIIEPNSGDVIVNGPFSSLLELGAGFHPDLTGRENIYLNASIYGMSRKEIDQRLDSIIDFSELERFIDVPVKHYSSGMYVRLGFAVAIHTDPKLLLIDEVLAVGDARFQAKCIGAIHRFRQQGGSLMLVSHDLSAIQRICNRAIWIEAGNVLADGPPTDVIMGYIQKIAQQEEDASSKHRGQPGEDSDEKRWGTGEIQVTEVGLYSGAGEKRDTFFTGEPMEIRLRYVAENRVPNAVFGIALYHQSGIHICGPNTSLGGLPIPYVEGEGEVIYHIPSLPVLEGGYELTIAVIDESDTIFYDYHDRLHKFSVYRGKTQESYGIFSMNGSWRIESQSISTKLADAPMASEPPAELPDELPGAETTAPQSL